MKNHVYILDHVAVIRLLGNSTKPIFTVIDRDDLARADAYPGTWSAEYCEHVRSHIVGATSLPINGKDSKLPLARWLLQPSLRNSVVDHINHDTLDNRRCNLRVVPPSGNSQNRRMQRNNTSGYRGVSWHKGIRKWKAQIKVSDQTTVLGYFDDRLEASLVYENARHKMMPLDPAFQLQGGIE